MREGRASASRWSSKLIMVILRSSWLAKALAAIGLVDMVDARRGVRSKKEQVNTMINSGE